MGSVHAPHILLLGAARSRSEGVRSRLCQRGFPADVFDLRQTACDDVLRVADVAAFVLDSECNGADLRRVEELLRRLMDRHVASVVWGAPADQPLPGGTLVDKVGPDASVDEVVGRISLLAQVAPTVRRLEGELDQMQRLSQQINRYFQEIDKEMQLAGRLQREFLPSRLPDVPRLHFAALYRPAGWVSGDSYDVFPIAPRHVGLFIGDAMGHGTAAGLMSMFLRTALVPTESAAAGPRVLGPAEALGRVQQNLVRLSLRQSQFVTAAYVVLNVETLEAQVARGGHPYPIVIRAGGELQELQPEGGLIGVADLPPEFAECRVSLAPGDKLLVYTDGIEDLFVAGRADETRAASFAEPLLAWRGLDAEALVQAMHEHLDRRAGSLNPDDDATAVVAQVMTDPHASCSRS